MNDMWRNYKTLLLARIYFSSTWSVEQICVCVVHYLPEAPYYRTFRLWCDNDIKYGIISLVHYKLSQSEKMQMLVCRSKAITNLTKTTPFPTHFSTALRWISETAGLFWKCLLLQLISICFHQILFTVMLF